MNPEWKRSFAVNVLASTWMSLAIVSGAASAESGSPTAGQGDPAAAPTKAGLPDPAQVSAAWERLKSFVGNWRDRSTKGWEEATTFRLIADGSVLLETSQFKDDPSGRNAMASAIHLDGERLLLTHYCEAKNQPRLVLSGIGDGGNRLLFTFLDGTGMASRDRWHMDSLELRLVDRDHFRSRWTSYQNGKSAWMEDIEFVRVRSD